MRKYNNYTADDFTFVVCAYKECEYLDLAVKSLKEQTVQAKIMISTSTPNEHIQSVADKYGAEIRVNPDGGQIKDYNFAMAQPDTKLIMLMHQDEILDNRFLEKVLTALNYSENPIIAFTNYIEMHNDIVDEKPSLMIKIKRLMLLPMKSKYLAKTIFGKRLIQLLGNPITHPTVVCVKSQMPEEIFVEKYKAAMDWDLWERLSRKKGSFVYVNEVLLYHRMNDENQTSKLLKTTNARYDDELELLCRFWPKRIAKIIMKLYSKSAKYY